jgi:hypothetical protein
VPLGECGGRYGADKLGSSQHRYSPHEFDITMDVIREVFADDYDLFGQ